MNVGKQAITVIISLAGEKLRHARLRTRRIQQTAPARVIAELFIPLCLLFSVLCSRWTLADATLGVLFYGVVFFWRYRQRTWGSLLSCILSTVLCTMTATLLAAAYLIRASAQKSLMLLQQANPNLNFPEQVNPGWGLRIIVVTFLLLASYELVLTSLKAVAFKHPGRPLASVLESVPNTPPT